MNRHHRRRAARLNRDQPKIRFVRTSMSPEEVATALGACTCPALISTGAGLIVVEHQHVHGCPSLYRMLREEATP